MQTEQLLAKAELALSKDQIDKSLVAELACELELTLQRCIKYQEQERLARVHSLEILRSAQWTIKFLRAHRDALLGDHK